MGSKESDECKIDTLAQAWSVISGVADAAQTESALNAVENHLIDDKHGLIKLLTPPFANTKEDPGYIKGYVAGVRENGGQYTHAACWTVEAFALAGRTNRAAELLKMLSPIRHTKDAAGVERYKVEPYVIAADIYGAAPHEGRGGWTWYTGSAGWMFRVGLEFVLGLEIQGGNMLRFTPKLPDSWDGYRISYRLPGEKTIYKIAVSRGRKGLDATIDGRPTQIERGTICVPIISDGAEHHLFVQV
jgi:cyclic beta-1,2-glucan synthetase